MFEQAKEMFAMLVSIFANKFVTAEVVTAQRVNMVLPMFVNIGTKLDFSEMETKEMFANGTMDAIEERLP